MYYEKLTNLGIKLRRRSGSEKTTCPQCSESRRNKKDPCLSVNITNGDYCCHNCSWKGNVRFTDKRKDDKAYQKPSQSMLQNIELNEKVVKYFDGRGISKQTLDKFFIHAKEEWMPQTQKKERCIVFPYMRDTEIVNAKFRDGNKNFKLIKDAELILFGMQTLKGRRAVILTEGECFTDTCEVLTKNGWIKISDYDNCEVAQYNENGTISFVYPKAKIIKDFNGNLLEFSNTQKFYSLTTPEHNLVLEKNGILLKKKAIELTTTPYNIPRTALHNGKGINLSNEQIKLCIAVSADFTIRKTGDLYCRLKKDRKAERLKEILNNLGIKYSLNKDSRNYYSFFIRRGDAPKYVFKLFPNEWIYNSSLAQKNLIINEILYWDGNSVPNRQQIEYSSKEIHNATFIQTISSLCGYCATVIKRKNNFGEWYKVSILFNKQNTSTIGLLRKRKEVKYNGKVYCLSVDSGMLLVRQNQCISVSGNCDTLSSYEAGFGQDYELTPNDDGELVEHELGRWATLSVPNGASKGNQRLDYIDNCSDWLADIDEFVLAVDNDEAGIALRDELLRRLGVEKCRFVEYPTEKVVTEKNGTKRACKDMNEVLVHFGKEKVREIILNSYMLPVEGINYLEDIFESMLNNFRKGIQLAPTTRFKAVDEYFRWKKGDINLFSGYANAGKTTFVLQMMLIKSIYDGWKWAIFSPENYPANDFYDDLVEMYVGKWLDKTSEDEYIDACKFINEHFFYVYPENEHTIEKIHEKFRYLVLKKGIDGVLIDPFNQLDKEQKPYEREDQYLSTVLKEVKRFALMNAIVYNIIAHPKNPTYEKDKALPPPNMYDISGGSMWGNKTDGMIIYHRPDIHIDKSSPNVQIHVVKTKRKRTGGKNGEFDLQMIWGCKRFCDPLTNEIPCDPIKAKQILLFEKAAYHQENGGDNSDEFAPF